MDIKDITTEQEFHIATDWNRKQVKGNIVEFNIDMGEHVFFIHKNMDPFGKGYRVSELTTGLAITTEEALTKAKAKRIAEERLSKITPEKLTKRINKQLKALSRNGFKTPLNRLV